MIRYVLHPYDLPMMGYVAQNPTPNRSISNAVSHGRRHTPVMELRDAAVPVNDSKGAVASARQLHCCIDRRVEKGLQIYLLDDGRCALDKEQQIITPIIGIVHGLTIGQGGDGDSASSLICWDHGGQNVPYPAR